MIDYGLGSLVDEVIVEYTGEGFNITVGVEYAVYLEYGTGIVGSENQHPQFERAGWEYDVNNHGEKGWWYPTNENDPNPHKKTANGILYGHTKGHPSRPFMYETWFLGDHIVGITL